MGLRTVFLTLLATLAVLGPATAARADCLETAPGSRTVVCTGPSPAGFDALGVPGYTITALAGSTVGSGVSVDGASRVSNLGTFVVDPFGTGVTASGSGNTIANSGLITGAGDNSTGILTLAGNAITNTGTVTLGDLGIGIAGGDNETIVNSGTIRTGADGIGIQIFNLGTATNNGTIIIGNSTGGPTYGMGIGSCCAGDSSTLVNNGTVRVGDDAVGLFANGNGNTLQNFGTIVVGDSTGTAGGIVVAFGDNNNVLNAGSIAVGVDGIGIAAFGNANTITNSGQIAVGPGNNFGSIGLALAGDGGRVVNSGSITTGDDGTGIFLNGANGIVTNAGQIRIGSSTGFLADAIGGIFIDGNGATVANSGSIVLGDAALPFDVVGIRTDGNNPQVTNSGTILGGSGTVGIQGLGDGSIIVNTGTIAVGTPAGLCSIGIDTGAGTGAIITNSGKVAARGCGSFGVRLGAADTLTNSGLIFGPDGGPGLGNSIVGVGAGNTVLNAGTLDGAINLTAAGDNTVTNAGLITVSSPWTGAGVFHGIDGVFTQTAAGTLALRVDAPGGADSLTVFGTTGGISGTANLGGTLRATIQPGLYQPVTTYSNVLLFTTSAGQFASVTSSSPFFTATALYNPGSVDLVLTRIPFGQVPGGGSNAQNLGTVLEQNYSTTLTGTAATFYSLLLASTAPDTLKQLAGEVSTTAQTAAFAVFGQFLGLGFGQTGSVRAGGTAGAGSGTRIVQTAGGGTRVSFDEADACSGIAACDPKTGRRWSMWVQLFGGKGLVNGDAAAGSSGVTLSTNGGATGVDVQLTPEWLVGFTVGGASASYTLDGTTSSGSATSTVFGLYGGYTPGPFYVDGSVGVGFGKFATQRILNTGAVVEQINGNFDGHIIGGRIEAGWRVDVAGFGLTPFAGLGVQVLRQNAYTESARDLGTGAPGLFGLSVREQTTTSLRSTLGAQVSRAIAFDDQTVMTPRLRLGWAHEFNPDRTANASFASLPNTRPFNVAGARAASDSLLVSAGVDVDVAGMVRLYAQFDGDFSAQARTWSGMGGIRLFW